MRKVIRILRRTGVAISLILCLVVFVLWVRSYSRKDFAVWTRAGREGEGLRRTNVQAMSILGKIWVEVGSMHVPPGARLGWHDVISDVEQLEGSAELRMASLKLQAWDHFGAPDYGKRRLLPMRWQTWHGFEPNIGSYSGRNVVVAHWVLAGAFSIWPALSLYAWRRRRNDRGAGLCLHCGYDLRASPERCPECGAVNSQGSLTSANSVEPCEPRGTERV